MLRDHHQVTLAHLDEPLAPGAHVALARRVPLHRDDHLVIGGGGHPRTAHNTSSTVTASAATIATRSPVERRWRRNGLNPIGAW